MEDEKREVKEKKSKKKAEDSCVAPAPCSACGGSEEVYRDIVCGVPTWMCKNCIKPSEAYGKVEREELKVIMAEVKSDG